jgi:ElaA protein
VTAGEVTIRRLQGRADLDAALALREQVFCIEQGVPREEEIDGRDEEAMHLGAIDPGGQVLGTLRLLFGPGVVKVGRVAVTARRRGEGIATRMLELALAESRRRGCERARLASQLEAIGLYERAGFAVCSGVFEDAGIPHVWMELELQRPEG